MRIRTVALVSLAALTSVALAQQSTSPPKSSPSPPPQQLKAVSLGVVPYPAKKQSTDLQMKDDSECFDWAKQSTGIDPAAPVSVAQADAKTDAKSSGVARGAARGAAKGAIAGEIIDDKGGEGAAVGAVAGASRAHRQSKAADATAQQQAEADAKAAQAARLDTFRKGYAACMETRGYTIK